MTDLYAEGTREDAAATWLGVCRGLSQSASCIPSEQLAELNTAELLDLRQVVTAGIRTGDDAFVLVHENGRADRGRALSAGVYAGRDRRESCGHQRRGASPRVRGAVSARPS